MEVAGTRGYAIKDAITDFLCLNYTVQIVTKIVLGLSEKTIRKYANRLAETPPEKKYNKFSWTKANRL